MSAPAFRSRRLLHCGRRAPCARRLRPVFAEVLALRDGPASRRTRRKGHCLVFDLRYGPAFRQASGALLQRESTQCEAAARWQVQSRVEVATYCESSRASKERQHAPIAFGSTFWDVTCLKAASPPSRKRSRSEADSASSCNTASSMEITGVRQRGIDDVSAHASVTAYATATCHG